MRVASAAPRNSANRCASCSSSPRRRRPSGSTVTSVFVPFALARQRPARRPSCRTAPGLATGLNRRLRRSGSARAAAGWASAGRGRRAVAAGCPRRRAASSRAHIFTRHPRLAFADGDFGHSARCFVGAGRVALRALPSRRSRPGLRVRRSRGSTDRPRAAGVRPDCPSCSGARSRAGHPPSRWRSAKHRRHVVAAAAPAPGIRSGLTSCLSASCSSFLSSAGRS